jgi:hypothetical protein
LVPGHDAARPPGLTVPACRACNSRWQRVEDTLAHDLLLVTSPDTPEAAGVHARFGRGWHASAGKDEQDARRRAGRALKILKTMQWVPPAPGRPQPTLRTAGGILIRASPARRIENINLRELAEKFIRGLHYAECGEVLGPVQVQAFLLNEERVRAPELQPMLEILQTLRIEQALGPGFWYRRHHEPGMSAWAFFIWGQITIVALARRDGTTAAGGSADL